VSAQEDGLRATFVAWLAGNRNAYRDCLQQLSGHLRAYMRRRLARMPADVEDLVWLGPRVLRW
jgi:RNA polymerase sigma-70 factor (ECF subfamily)